MEVEILGIPADCFKEKTKVVQRNGNNPIWQNTFQFRVGLDTSIQYIQRMGNGVDQVPKFCRGENRAETRVSSALGHAELESDLI